MGAQGAQLSVVGRSVSKATGTLAATTVPLFTVTGIVAVTSLVGEVTTSITVANSYTLQANPTVGATKALAAATDIGTTDTPVGEVLVCELDGSALELGVTEQLQSSVIIPAGVIEHVSAGTDGAITWRLTYVPLTSDGAVTAA